MKASDLRQTLVVRRWGIVDLPHRQSLAEHQYLVTMTAIHFCLLLGKPNLLMPVAAYALVHDLEETFTGDVPGPVKRKIVDKRRHSEWVSGEMRKRFPDHLLAMRGVTNDSEVRAIVKLADLAEMFMDARYALELRYPVSDVLGRRQGDLNAHMVMMGLTADVKEKIQSYCYSVVQEPTRVSDD